VRYFYNNSYLEKLATYEKKSKGKRIASC